MTKAQLRFDGLYQAPTKSGVPAQTRSFLRFFADGVVLRVSSIAPPQDVAGFLVKGYRAGPWSADGKYTLNGDKLELTFAPRQDRSHPLYKAEAPERDVKYVGRLVGGELQLRSTVRMNNRDGEQADWKFTFVQV